VREWEHEGCWNRALKQSNETSTPWHSVTGRDLDEAVTSPSVVQPLEATALTRHAVAVWNSRRVVAFDDPAIARTVLGRDTSDPQVVVRSRQAAPETLKARLDTEVRSVERLPVVVLEADVQELHEQFELVTAIENLDADGIVGCSGHKTTPLTC